MDLLRRHTEEEETNIIFIKTAVVDHRVCIARKNGARQTSFVPRLGSAWCRNQRAKRCQVFTTPFGNTSDEAPKLQVEEPTSF